MSDDRLDKVRVHVSDGIEEYDNPLPKWWLGLFWICIGIAFVYMLHYHIMGGLSLRQEFQNAIAEQQANQSANGSNNGAAEKYVGLVTDISTINAGKEVYATNCAPCHGGLGQGGVGPNLTDKFWIHGGSPAAILKTITDGVPEKGMLAWSPILGADKVGQVMTYVVSLKGTNPPDPKAPEGTQEN